MFTKSYTFWCKCLALVVLSTIIACAPQKKKKKTAPTSFMGKTYHNVTAKYNAYFNAGELYNKSVLSLSQNHQDNFNQLIPVYDYIDAGSATGVTGDLTTAIEKCAKVMKKHPFSAWADDCYFLVGQCQYVNQEYETAMETFEYLIAEYNPEAMEKKAAKGKKKKRKKKKRKKKKSKKKKKSSKKKKEEEEQILTEEDAENYFLKKRPAYEQGMVWLARTFTERKQYDKAALIFDRIDNDAAIVENLGEEVEAARAHLSIQTAQYDQAIVSLEKALDSSKKKKNKVRYAYLLGQLYEKSGNIEKSFEYFDKVKKYGPTYDMSFNSTLSKLMNGWKSGAVTTKKVMGDLERMLKDSKNKEYKDKIYFAMANIALTENDKEAGIAYLKKSAASNVDDKPQKAEAYYKLASIYFEDEIYKDAKFYFDSTKISMEPTDDRYEEVAKYAENLEDIAINILLIEESDSLLKIANMTPEEKAALAAAVMEKIRKKQEQELLNSILKNQPSSGDVNAARLSNFFAYDEKALKRGYRAFEKKWGDRKLEDNWRRSNKTSLEEDEGTSGTSFDNQITATTVSEADFKNLFADVPSNPDEVREMSKKIEDALFALGTLYKTKLENHQKSVQALEDLLRKFPTTEHREMALCQLYLSYKNDLSQAGNANKYKAKLVQEFPKSVCAAAASNPNFDKEAEGIVNELNKDYDAAYADFQNGKYKSSNQKIEAAIKEHGESNGLKPQFDLLKAFNIGKLEGKTAYMEALKVVIVKHKKTPQGKRANEILLYLKGGKLPSDIVATNDKKEDKKADKKEEVGDPSIYKYEANKSHYMAVVLEDEKALKALKKHINSFNDDNFKNKNLRAASIYLGKGKKKIPLLIIRRMRNADDAKKYYDAIIGKREQFLNGNKADIFLISQTNYRTILKNKHLDGYRSFFMTNYF